MTHFSGADLMRLPEELRERAQWCLAGPDKAPCLAGTNGLYNASPTKGPWLDFQTACYYAEQYQCSIGYILTVDDPFSCIDMDVKDVGSVDKDGAPVSPDLYTPQAHLDFYAGVVQFANSYTEISRSGQGLHVWVRGDIGAGRRGKGMEVYSQERFIICTGRSLVGVVYHNLFGRLTPHIIEEGTLPIGGGDLILQSLTQELGVAAATIDLEEVGDALTDEVIWQRASTAGNAQKFIDLCGGGWQRHQFPSQSEADLALMSMFTFYSKSNEQCRRMFRLTGLGQRAKAIKNDVYLNRTLKIIRGRQADERATAEHGAAICAGWVSKVRATPQETATVAPASPQPPAPAHHYPPESVPIASLLQTDSATPDPRIQNFVSHMDQALHTETHPNEVAYQPPEVDGLPWPPGLVGSIAGFIYQSAPRPVKEVAIVAALGLMAGITGKAYNIGQTGINLYIILIARSAIGKEAMHSGIGHILRSPCGLTLDKFVDYTDYASGPALTKAMEGFTSFVNVSGEWGRKLQRMADDRKEGPMQQLRTVMTNLYQKSGAASVMGGLGYSNRDQNVASVNAVAYSMIGETTPGTFYDSLTQSMMEDGFLSRFNIIEYEGERPPENKNQMTMVPEGISDALSSIAAHCIPIVTSPNANAIQIPYEPQAEAIMQAFNLQCDANIRTAGGDESIRQIWNRAHLKAIRVAGVLAASDNHTVPIITVEHINWAIGLIESDAASMLRKIQGGDVGTDDTARFLKMQKILGAYLRGQVATSYGIDPRMVKDGVVPRSYLQIRTRQVRSFMTYRLGSALALDHTIKAALDSGYLMEIAKEKSVAQYGYHGRCFGVLNLD